MIKSILNWIKDIVSPRTAIHEEPVFGWTKNDDISALLHIGRRKVVVRNDTAQDSIEIDLSGIKGRIPLSVGELEFGFDALLRTTITIPVELGSLGIGETVVIKLTCIDPICIR